VSYSPFLGEYIQQNARKACYPTIRVMGKDVLDQATPIERNGKDGNHFTIRSVLFHRISCRIDNRIMQFRVRFLRVSPLFFDEIFDPIIVGGNLNGKKEKWLKQWNFEKEKNNTLQCDDRLTSSIRSGPSRGEGVFTDLLITTCCFSIKAESEFTRSAYSPPFQL
jgi:hypothetical protein